MYNGDWFHALGGIVHVEGNLHRSPLPFTAEHWRLVRDAGIRVVFSMEEAATGDLARSAGLDWRPHFWTDDQPPKHSEIEAFLGEYLAIPQDRPALVHCKAGWGRTGTAIACALMARNGWSAAQALTHYWARVPRARAVMLRNGQAEFVRGFGARLEDRGL